MPAGPGERRHATNTERDHEELLRRLALHDEATVVALLRPEEARLGACALDDRARALVRLGALVAVGAAGASYQWAVDAALAAGATDAEIVGVVAAVAPVVGTSRSVPAAVALAASLGLPGEEAPPLQC